MKRCDYNKKRDYNNKIEVSSLNILSNNNLFI